MRTLRNFLNLDIKKIVKKEKNKPNVIDEYLFNDDDSDDED